MVHLSLTNALNNRAALPEFGESHIESWNQEPVQVWHQQEKDGGEWISGEGLSALSSYLAWQAKNKPYIIRG
jgi:hypothetical protein